jgi:hypothetical protein
VVLAARLGRSARHPLEDLAVESVADLGERVLGVDAGVPDVEVAHAGQPSHRVAITLDRPSHSPATIGLLECPLPGRYDQTRCQTLHAPIADRHETLDPAAGLFLQQHHGLPPSRTW